MKRPKGDPPQTTDLRRQEEARLRVQVNPPPSDADARRLLQEMQVHRVEMEMQNEEIRLVREEAEKALERYTELYELAPVGYFALDKGGLIRSVNLAGAGFLDTECSRLQGRPFELFVSEEHRPAFHAFLDKVFESRAKMVCELAFSKQGTRQVFARIEALPSADGLECRATVTDITDRKRAEDALRGAKEELEQKVQKRTKELAQRNADLQDFAFVASHDLQEPLRKIRSFGGLLTARFSGSLPEEGRDYLERMQKAAARMQNLIDSLLSYSRVSTKSRPFSPVDLGKAVKEALSDLEIQIRETGGRLEVDHLPTLDADEGQMIELLQNLIGNALKFRREGEPPQVKIYSLPVDEGRPPGQRVYRIFVEDKGIGFDEKYLDRIFVPFERLHGRGVYGGVGMGLAICRKIAERHGGQITARSTPGKGSVFIVTLPEKPFTPL